MRGLGADEMTFKSLVLSPAHWYIQNEQALFHCCNNGLVFLFFGINSELAVQYILLYVYEN